MKDYRLFDISDFVMDDDFIRWVSQGEKADNDFWHNWLDRHPDKHMIVAEARRMLELIGSEERVSNEIERQSEISRLLRTIKEQPYEIQSHAATATKVKSVTKKWWYAAAVVFIASLGVYFFGNRHKGSEQYAYAAVTSSKHLIENINTSEKAITLRLPDESTVELAPNSRISYSNDFDSNSTRDIYLSGQAFFTVTKNPARPFRVFANEIVTKVLGTRFSVRCYERDTVIQIRVRTGKVSIYSQNADAKETGSPNHLGGIILTPNQELVYKRSNREFQKTLLENPVAIVADAIDQKNMLYEEASLEKVFNQLSKMYGINIVYDNEVLKKCTLTADLRNELFYRKLELICKAIGAHYEVMDGQVVIQSNGCE
jgi:ferric-dicitrate binding protein FerR (iron transport regulator)